MASILFSHWCEMEIKKRIKNSYLIATHLNLNWICSSHRAMTFIILALSITTFRIMTLRTTIHLTWHSALCLILLCFQSAITLSNSYAECPKQAHYAECHCADCCYAACHGYHRTYQNKFFNKWGQLWSVFLGKCKRYFIGFPLGTSQSLHFRLTFTLTLRPQIQK